MSSVPPGIILASSSPRRREILTDLEVPFTVDAPHIVEDLLPGESPPGHVRRLAEEKARTVAAGLKEGIVIGADTVVVLDGTILGKPEDAAGAADMLRTLAGRRHQVFTGVAVIEAASGRMESAVSRSRVTMREMTDDEIAAYVETGEPLDKAGAYAVQGEGRIFVREVEGSLTNVIGLPAETTRSLLGRFGCDVPPRKRGE